MSGLPYRDGKVHVLDAMCATCVFRPGNVMQLTDERFREITEGNAAADSALTCHSTLYRDDVDQAVCFGFWKRYRSASLPLRLAGALPGVVTFVPPPVAEH